MDRIHSPPLAVVCGCDVHRHEEYGTDMEILMAGYAGRAGASSLARSSADVLKKELPEGVLSAAKKMGPYLQIPDSVPLLARERLGKGGVLRGLWILGEKLQCGFDVDLRSILLKQEDVEVCELLGADIYRIDASGGWLVASGKAEDALRIFRKENIPASVIGICRAGLQRQLRLGDDIRFLKEP